MEEYSYPGQLLAELQAESRVGEEYSAELPVDPGVVHREMSEAGFDYYTGKQEFLRHGRGTPPEVYEVLEPDGTKDEYSLLGVSEPGYTAHYTRYMDSEVEVMRRVWHRTGELGHQKDLESFEQFPWVQLENYVEGYNWQYLEEPDYDRLEEKYQTETSTSESDWEVGESEQSGLGDF